MHLKEKWKAVVEDWKKSGLSQAEYSKRAGVKSTKLSYWKRKLELEDLVIGKSDSINENENRNEFVEVTNPVKE